MTETVEIVRLGHSGDGVTADGLFVPYTVPGDTVRIAREGKDVRALEIVTPGPSRAAPLCAHFGKCGGCALQHVARDTYLTWKREQIVAALEHRGLIGIPVGDIHAVAPGTRRRAVFKARKDPEGVALGFYAPGTHTLIDVQECPVLTPSLMRLLPPLRRALNGILKLGNQMEVHATETDTGIDLTIRSKRERTFNWLSGLAGLAQELKLARLSWNEDLIALNFAPALRIGRYSVVLPPQPFLQPTQEGERILQALVCEGVGTSKRVADLFSGCGTFALSLAEGRKIFAVDEGGAMLDALLVAARAGGGDVTIEKRDLFRRPLTPSELTRFDAVVIDPPRPGAKAQAEQLAQSRVPRVVYVSCNVASFARDARILSDGGYRLERVTPVDQFLWSPHVELVGVFERA